MPVTDDNEMHDEQTGGLVLDFGEEFDSVEEAHQLPKAKFSFVVKSAVMNHNEERGTDSIRVQLDCVNPPEDGKEYAPIFMYAGVPNQEKDAENDAKKGHEPGTTYKMKLLMLKRLIKALDLPVNDGQIDVSQWAGHEVPNKLEVTHQPGQAGQPPRAQVVIPMLAS